MEDYLQFLNLHENFFNKNFRENDEGMEKAKKLRKVVT